MRLMGMAHYLLMLRSAFVLQTYEGLVMRAGLTRVPLRLFVATIVSWAVAAYRKARGGWSAFDTCRPGGPR